MGAPARIRVGPAGWAYDDWRGIVYPEDMPRTRPPLSLLSEWFDTVEINVTFYRLMDPHQTRRWPELVAANPRFAFCAKLWRGFTHDPEFDAFPEAAARFLEGLRPLRDAGRLGMLLAQFPWSFRRTEENRVRLARLADAFEGLPLAVEVRHDSWDRAAFYTGLEARGVTLCAVDQPPLRGCLLPSDRVTARAGYIRLHGRNAEHWFRQTSDRDDRYNYLYAGGELAEWVTRARSMAKKVNDLFIVTNNHYRGQAVVNALELQHALDTLHVDPPPWLVRHYPRLSALRRGTAAREEGKPPMNSDEHR
ncbi:MAG: DUF72 domain-containing protein [Candidatus Hydrogenedentes bacterium]|nr:DUF72 domain-containing protein [Candidatus Hydrogenedentota bacterium]